MTKRSEFYPVWSQDISGLARKCPKCELIFHAEVKTRKAVMIRCPECDHEFEVKKYRRGERPK